MFTSLAFAALMLGLSLVGGTFQHTPATRRIAIRLKESLEGLPAKVAAAEQGLDEGTWHKQVEAEGVTPSLYRTLGLLPRPHVVKFLTLLGKDFGLTVLDSDDVNHVFIERVYRLVTERDQHRKAS